MKNNTTPFIIFDINDKTTWPEDNQLVDLYYSGDGERSFNLTFDCTEGTTPAFIFENDCELDPTDCNYNLYWAPVILPDNICEQQ